MSAVPATNLGFPRIGPRRELKQALEQYWAGKSSKADLSSAAASIRQANWRQQHALGLDHIPSNDFSLYDHVLDTAAMVGAIPDRYRAPDGGLDLDSYFCMARGGTVRERSLPALEMTKWSDTNYHYIVPELASGQPFALTSTKVLDEFAESVDLGIPTRPVLLGPVSFLLLSKHTGSPEPLTLLLDRLVTVYEEVLEALERDGATWVQMDEPVLALDLDPETRSVFALTYRRLRDAAPGLSILVAAYFAGYGENLSAALELPVNALHLDLVRDGDQLEHALSAAPSSLALSMGIVNGRNVWRADLEPMLVQLEHARGRLGAERMLIAPSCSLLHVPVDLTLEETIDDTVKTWLAFAVQRIEEVVVLSRALNEGRAAVEEQLRAATSVRDARRTSKRVNDPGVGRRLTTLTPELETRSPFGERRTAQRARLSLPVLPTTTIGSFPQTAEVRQLRLRERRGEITAEAYERRLRELVADTVRFQESVGLDVLVHGEFERNDMVEYFGEHLAGMAVTANGWVQSYGSRCVKPPVIFGDVSRPHPITVGWTAYAQSLTDRPMKGMLTGPVTILKWSFVRDDQPLETTCRQIALAIRDEVADLEAAGIGIVQIDEPALREGLPLHATDQSDYLRWAVRAFRLASSGVADATQIHTHMCYGEFNDLINSITAFDADVISIEASRSGMELLRAFTDFRYPNEIGPGIWDIHSPRVPSTTEMQELLEDALTVLDASSVWVNPDCGLKTRSWDEVEPALRNMVDAARLARARVAATT